MVSISFIKLSAGQHDLHEIEFVDHFHYDHLHLHLQAVAFNNHLGKAKHPQLQ